MEKFDLKNLTPEMRAEIQACKSTEELKAYFAAKNIDVPEEKLDTILTLAKNFDELSLEDLEAISGGECCLSETGDCWPYSPCYSKQQCWSD